MSTTPPGNGRTRRLGCLDGSDERPRRKLDLSYNYLLTIVAELRRAGFVKMRRGPAGGLPAGQTGTRKWVRRSRRDDVCLVRKNDDALTDTADGATPTPGLFPQRGPSAQQLPSLCGSPPVERMWRSLRPFDHRPWSRNMFEIGRSASHPCSTGGGDAVDQPSRAQLQRGHRANGALEALRPRRSLRRHGQKSLICRTPHIPRLR